MKKLFMTSMIFFLCSFYSFTLGEKTEESVQVGYSAPLFSLRDQYDSKFGLEKHRGSIIILFIGNRYAREDLRYWGTEITNIYGEKIRYIYIISMPNVPFFLKGWIKGKFKGKNEDTEEKKGSVLLDWGGVIFKKYTSIEKSANIILIDREGIIRNIERGKTTSESKERLFKSIGDILSKHQ